MSAADDLARWNRRQYAAQRRASIRAQAVEYLGGKCRICGYDKCIAAFDFHHIDPMEKDFNISSATSWEKAKAELDKCELLCSNCHREVHDGLHPEYLNDGYEGGAYGTQYDPGWAAELEDFDA
jgi:predicted HNH restriction endonuclease